MAGGHNKVEYCSGSHLKKSGFRSIDLSLPLALSLEWVHVTGGHNKVEYCSGSHAPGPHV